MRRRCVSMPKTLVVVESPAKAKTIEKYLGGEYAVRASYGHIRDLGKGYGGLGVDVEHDFQPDYVVPEDSKRHVSELKSALKQADDVILATDYDREGEAIAFHVATLLGVDPERAKRVTFTEITRDAILEAFTHPRAIDLKLFDAQEARRILDRLVGYRISPILWRRVRPGLSAGRVQSVAVRLIVEREREIRAFVPVEYWSVDVRLTPEDVEQPFVARLVEIPEGRLATSPEKKGVLLAAEADAATHAERLGRAAYRVAQRRAEGAQALAGPAVHHVHHATGGRAQARVQRAQDDDARPAPVRRDRPARRGLGRPDHLHAHRLREHRRDGAARDHGAGEERVRGGLRAGRGPPLQDEEPQRAGGARGHPADQRDAHPAARGLGARSRPAPPLHPDLAAHGGHPDGRGPLQPGGRRRGRDRRRA